jgi:hypothetical protein
MWNVRLRRVAAGTGDRLSLHARLHAAKHVTTSAVLASEVRNLLGVFGEQRIIQRECHKVLHAHRTPGEPEHALSVTGVSMESV